MLAETLRVQRDLHRTLAIDRDGGYCVFCRHPETLHPGEGLQPVSTRMAAVHHVFGRDRKRPTWREHFSALVCCCNECHPAPLYLHGWTSDDPIVEMMRRWNLECGLTWDGAEWHAPQTKVESLFDEA